MSRDKEFNIEDLLIDQSKFDFKSQVKYAYKTIPGLNKQVVEAISDQKQEPKWMRDLRLKSLEVFETWRDPRFGVDISDLDVSKIVAYIKPDAKKATSWEEVPSEIKDTFDKLGIPEAERKALAGVGAQYDSEIVYQNIKKELEKLGVIFLDMESAVR
ncbi:MAG: Fe-S cluster assembly protein SufB, partial [Defluviitoga tunisiensis]